LRVPVVGGGASDRPRFRLVLGEPARAVPVRHDRLSAWIPPLGGYWSDGRKHGSW